MAQLEEKELAEEIVQELYHATELSGQMCSPHEALGIIEEEFIEFRDEVFRFNLRKNRDTRPQMREELIQLAAMCMRAILDLELRKRGVQHGSGDNR